MKTIAMLLLNLGFSGIVQADEYITVVMEDGKLVQVNTSLIVSCGTGESGRSSNSATSWSFKYHTGIEKIIYEDNTKIFVITNDGHLCSINPSSVSRLNNFESQGVKIFDINKRKVKDASFYRAR